MSCPVVRAIEELYGGYEYNTDSYTRIVDPSGFSGGGSTSTDIIMESAKFYITVRKLQFARAELINDRANGSESKAKTDSDITTIAEATVSNDSINPVAKIYFERMFQSYYGKTSSQILEEILCQSLKKIYIVITKVIDIVDIMEGVCSSKLARDFPSGMSLPAIFFNPEVIENINTDHRGMYMEICKIIDYANKLCVAGVRAKIDNVQQFDKKLRVFTFSKSDETLAGYKKLQELDMEVAEYAHALEQYYCGVIAKLSEILKLCQSIIDLAQ